MTLHAAIEAYVGLKQSLGAVFRTDRRILRSFGARRGDVELTAITSEHCQDFYGRAVPASRFAERKHQSLRGFFHFLQARGHLGHSPLPEPGPRALRNFRPYVYSRKELQRLLDATEILQSSRSLLQGQTVRALLLTLYGAGLRASEGLRLQRRDVDLVAGVLHIRDTKFFKSRQVPIGTTLREALAIYAVQRAALPMPEGDGSAFFATHTGQPLGLARLERVFRRLCAHADIARPGPTRWQPRLHDLRHTFAVHRLVAWYREGADVQTCLPLLATYLGHLNVAGTQPYLTMTPELLAEAARRFERYATASPQEAR